MSRSRHVTVQINLTRVRDNAREIKQRLGPTVAVIAVVKADAYGLGAARVAVALADVVDEFCVFSLDEAIEADLLKQTGKQTLALSLPQTNAPDEYLRYGVRPAVSTVEQAKALRPARCVLSVDTGMQRFACPPAEVERVLDAGGCTEAFTHATRIEAVHRLTQLVADRRQDLRLHAAGTDLLGVAEARLDAVRPGLALYRGAVHVAAPLAEVHTSAGPVGYTGFTPATGRHGVILAGYSHGVRRGPCLVDGRPSRVLEVGMQSSYVECSEYDQPGDEVVLLGDGVSEDAVALAWGTTAQLVLVQLCGAGEREYLT